MNKEDRKEVRKIGRLLQRLHEIFAMGGYGRIPYTKVPYPQDEPKVFETVLIEPGHVMCARLPVGKIGDALTTLMKDTGCEEDFKYPALEKFMEEGSSYSLHYLLEALNAIAITDENVHLKLGREKDYPIEIMGMESGIKFVIAPRMESV